MVAARGLAALALTATLASAPAQAVIAWPWQQQPPRPSPAPRPAPPAVPRPAPLTPRPLTPRPVAPRLVGQPAPKPSPVAAPRPAAAPTPPRVLIPLPTAVRPDQAAAIREVLAAAPTHGLPARELPANASVEVLLAAAIDYASAQHGGRIAGARLPGDWRIRPAPYDARAELAAALAADRLAAWLQEAPPPYEGYRRLQAALAQYRGFAAAGGWSALQVKLTLKPGEKGPDVPALRKRLIAEGYAVGEAGEDPSLYDDKLVQAVSIFQRLHGLADAGVIGRQTVEAFNAPPAARIATLEANLERWRWLPPAMPATRIEVNTGAALVEVYDAGQVKLAMRAIVGKPASPTPMMSEEIERVVFNPPWNVPAGITAKELLPRIRKDPGYMARNDFIWVGNRLQQKPGDKAALGRLKFDMPNDLDIYLHDTPARTLFVNDERHLSHGCVRLQSPRDLAIFALATAGLDGAGIDAAIATKVTSRTALAAPLPVFLIYRTAFVDADGQAQFRKDAYRWDEKLQALLGD